MRGVADPVQQRRSWYRYLLTSPLGEPALAWDDFAFVDRLSADWSPAFTPDPAHIAQVKDVLRAPGAALAAASYYKHLLLPELQDPALASASSRFGTAALGMPALYLHGADDGCIGAEVVPGTGHFLHLESPAVINARILEFLAS
jgi:pimeloyl-ACP methyl ester carboxylesterase